jgi:hypothetical protein
VREKNWEKRASIPLIQSGFRTPIPEKLVPLPDDLKEIPDDLKKLPEWPAGHVFLLLPCEGTLMLYTRIFQMRDACIQVSEDAFHWANLIGTEGLLFLISPGINECLGPLTLSEFLAYKLYPSAPETTTLADFANRSKPIPLPPVYI